MDKLEQEIETAERKAWEALGRYKFNMYGYWAAIWVHLVRVSGQPRPNPWRELVLGARAELARQDALGDVKVELGPLAAEAFTCTEQEALGLADVLRAGLRDT
jgi:hypothetical protein